MTVHKFQDIDDVVWEIAALLMTITQVEGIVITADEYVDAAMVGVEEANIRQGWSDGDIWPNRVRPHDLANAAEKAAEALVKRLSEKYDL